MDARETLKTILLEARVALMYHLDPLAMVDILREKLALSQEDEERIQGTPSETERVRQLLKILERGPENHMRRFFQAIKDFNPYLYFIVQKTVLRKYPSCGLPTGILLPPPASCFESFPSFQFQRRKPS
jgi:hypothetical protein